MTFYPKAFIYDLDGIITDTAEYHFLAWQKMAEELGIHIDRTFNERLKGIGRMESLQLILSLDPSASNLSVDEKEQLALKKNEYYLEMIERMGPKDILPGIEELLHANKQHGIRIALGSASKNAKHVLDLLGLTAEFDYIVDASTVKKGKPDPETFTAAADALNVPYSECIGIEDSAAGLEAINSANMFSVAVGDKAHLPNADYLVAATNELKFEEIINQYNQKKAAN
ncbi:Beta-phosphoglucomutase [Planococcus massiliensis]|uniref:Beta-phosphoglucomutase n=1 Tax=Planococcus massiliensis TaxID=1499687 RepID=A0A098EPD4_9BACL|nr:MULTISPECIES: beta-phosphoglucomutase [Planococcus]MCJ1910140.1 beta-phosphoglucomutase [Planococcus ruber]CEG23652.1 Beta-phosphoglucomutase [Planococcus massiliensis]